MRACFQKMKMYSNKLIISPPATVIVVIPGSIKQGKKEVTFSRCSQRRLQPGVGARFFPDELIKGWIFSVQIVKEGLATLVNIATPAREQVWPSLVLVLHFSQSFYSICRTCLAPIIGPRPEV